MTNGDRTRVEVGFDGGQGLAALVSTEAADALEHALGQNQEGSFLLEAEDGRYTIALRRVVYVKRYAKESRVGFGAVA